MTKDRLAIPSEISADVMFTSSQTCCVCTEPGKPVQIHHIDEDPSNNDPDNLAVMCLHCHNETQISGGFGRKLNAPLVRRHRDEWLGRVAQRRAAADVAAVERMAGVLAPAAPPPPVQATAVQKQEYSDARQNAILAYVESLPDTRTALWQRAKASMDSGTTIAMVNATYEYIEALQGLMAQLAAFYAPGTFGEDPRRFFSEMTAAHFRWHRAHSEPDGPGTGGTIVNVTCCGAVGSDLEEMIEDMARSLVGYDDRFNHSRWSLLWHRNS